MPETTDKQQKTSQLGKTIDEIAVRDDLKSVKFNVDQRDGEVFEYRPKINFSYYKNLFQNENAKSLLKELKSTLKNVQLNQAKKAAPTLSSLEFKKALERNQELKSEVVSTRKALKIIARNNRRNRPKKLQIVTLKNEVGTFGAQLPPVNSLATSSMKLKQRDCMIQTEVAMCNIEAVPIHRSLSGASLGTL